ncbi:MAG: PDZ domain-containing protein, partial [Marinirhabdus sp.]
MMKNFKVFFLAVFVAAASCSFTTKEFNDPDKDKLLIDLISYVLEKGHFSPKDLNDDFSTAVYDDFLEALDPLKRYFYASDIKEFNKYRLKIDDQLKKKDLTFFNLVYGRFYERMENTKKMYVELLEKPFDYTAKESLNADYENIPYVTSEAEMRERWRLQLKSNAIGSYYALIEEQKPKAENTATTEKKTPVQLEEEARDLTRTSLEEYFEFTDDLERKDYFAVFLNAIVEENDPHTNYFAPPDRDRFDLRMSGKLEGIGARLQKRNDFVKIIEIISGGPAWRGEHLEVGDLIMKVKQEDEEDPVSIVGMRLDDAVKLIKGPKGTKVTLTVKRLDGTIEEETITRDVVELEETYAKSTLIGKGEKKFGLINLPQFYFDMENYAQRNAAGD